MLCLVTGTRLLVHGVFNIARAPAAGVWGLLSF